MEFPAALRVFPITKRDRTNLHFCGISLSKGHLGCKQKLMLTNPGASVLGPTLVYFASMCLPIWAFPNGALSGNFTGAISSY